MKQLRDDEGIKAFGDRVRAIRREKGYTQEALAYKADIEIMQISRIERGIINTSLSQILNLAKALDISAEGFFSKEFPNDL